MTSARKLLWRCAMVAILVSISKIETLAQDANEPSFFPVRPTGVIIHTSQGILMRYGVGNKSGMFSLQTATGTVEKFYIGYPMHVNGKVIRCTIPPTDRLVPDKATCPDWPTNIRIGHTVMKVSYWDAVYNDQRVRVSDEMSNNPDIVSSRSLDRSAIPTH